MQSLKWPLSPKDSCPKINFGTSTVFEIYKFQKPLLACLGIHDHTHLKQVQCNNGPLVLRLTSQTSQK